MSSDPTPAPTGEAGLPASGKSKAPHTPDADLYVGMMGDGTEEQNLNQTGNPSARITQSEVEAAFGESKDAVQSGAKAVAEKVATTAASAKAAVKSGARKAAAEARPLAAEVEDGYDDVVDEASERINSMAECVSTVRDHVQQSAEAARAWALRQADAARQTASKKPVLAVSASAGAALAVGLAVGFIIGRATADEY